MSLGEVLRTRRILLVALAIVGAGVISTASTALGASSRSAVACAIGNANNLNAADIECFWNTEMAPASESSFQTASPILGTPVSVARAAQDQCFAGIGKNYPAKVGGACPAGSLPKTNQTYTWGLTKAGTNVWIGVAPNMGQCLNGSSGGGPRLSLDGAPGISVPTPPPVVQSASPPYGFPTMSVCEYGASRAANRQVQPLPAVAGDWYMPRVYRYATGSHTTTDMSTGLAALALNGLIGVRSAGTSPTGAVVFVGGPALSTSGGVRILAFNATTNRYIGSHLYTQYNDIRKWLVVGNQLYTAVGTTGPVVNGVAGIADGKLLRWTGTTSNPFSGAGSGFQEVGTVDSDAAELTSHGGRIFLSTWGGDDGATPGAIWMSGALPGSNILPTSNTMTKVWSTDQYEPDQQTKNRIGAGNLASFGGYLYWGTMQEPTTTGGSGSGSGGGGGGGGGGGHRTTSDRAVRLFGSQHPLSIWRGQLVGNTFQNIQLLYGDAQLPTDCGVAGDCTVAGDNGTKATYTTSLGNSNDDLVFTAASYGSDGNSITIEYKNLGASQALAVNVTGNAIAVTLATDGGGTVTTTAAQVKAAIDGNTTAHGKVAVALAASNNGTGVVSAFGPASLAGGSSVIWKLQPNKFSGAQGLCGPGGFSNYYNNYTWTMAVLGTHLYVGTMDMRGQIDGGQPTSGTASGATHVSENPRGADLWRFDAAPATPSGTGAGGCATAESVDGFGNQLTSGVRTLISDGTSLWAGMANPQNLWSGNQGFADALGVPNSGPGQVASQGGWQLFKLN